MLLADIGRFLIQMLARTSAIMIEVFCGLLQSLEVNVRIVPQLGDDHYY
jgi:hypothetical protein